VADASHPLLVAVDALASFAAAVPGASIAVTVDPISTVLASGAGVALAVAAVSRFPGRALVAAAACVGTLAWRPMLPAARGLTELHLIDVGQGDAIALRSARGRWVLFDAGRDWRGGDEGQRDVVPYIVRRGGPLVAFVLSHPHADHVGGATSTFRALRPSVYIDPGYAGATTPYLASLEEARRSRIRWTRVRPGDSLVVDEAVITFLAPDSTWASSQRDPNLASTVARVRVGDITMLLTGDAEAPEERWLLARDPAALRADVLKVAHHGSSTSSTDAFLAAVQPRLALVSVGAGNLYGHPSRTILRSLAAHGAVTLRTDLDGSVVVRTDGRRIDVEAAGERWTLAKSTTSRQLCSVFISRCRKVLQNKATSVVTIERFIIEQERQHPEATGQLSGILYDVALAAKMIANKVRSAGLADILGSAENENVQGEMQQKLDVFANETIIKAMDHTGRLCGMASEEEAGIIPIPDQFRCGKYCLMFDPLDGSSNIDVNVPVGTIFSIVQKITRGKHGEEEDFLQPGRRQVAAGYVIYGSSTMLVYTTGQGAHGFTLDPSIGEFLLSHPNIRIPNDGRYLSVNDAYEEHWDAQVRQLFRRYRA